MKRTLLLGGLLAAMLSSAVADESSHRAAVEQLFTTMDMEKTHAATLDNLLQNQIRSNPALMQVAAPMREFFDKHLGWAGLKKDMVKLYAETFTEEEVKQLDAFYQSPVGKKSIQQLPALMGKAMQIAQERMKEHLPELQETLKAAAAKAGGGIPPPPGGPAPAK